MTSSQPFSVEGITASVDQMVPLTMILNEALTNAFKYGLSNTSPELAVNAFRKNESIIISIKDNGPGFSNLSDEKVFGFFRDRTH